MAPLLNIALCSICEKPTTDRCSGCHNVYYCCKTHQKEDWPKHRLICHPYEVQSSPEFGPHLVATRDIKVNDVIVSELPLVIGQDPGGEHFDSCVGCSREIETLHFNTVCPKCKWQACRSDCLGLTDPTRHLEECPVLAPFANKATRIVPWKALLLPLRVLFLQKRIPGKWEVLKNLAVQAVTRQDESMVKELHDNPVAKMLRVSLALITQSASEIFSDSSDETMRQVYSLLEVYGTRLSKPAGAHLLALYPVAMYLQQDCLPNSIACFEPFPETAESHWRGRITVRAIKEIRKGEILTAINTNGMWCTKERQEEMLLTKGIRCKCARCMDPTEMGLHTGTVKCPKCSGWVLPTDTLEIQSGQWKCTKCGRLAEGRGLNELSSLFWGTMNMANPKGLPRFETAVPPSQKKIQCLLEKGFDFLHPNHQICLSAKVLLIAYYSNELVPGNIEKMSVADLEKCAAFCKDVVKALDAMGYSHNRLAMYASESLLDGTRAEVELLKRRFRSKVWNRKQATKAVVEYRGQLRKILTVLRAETNNPVNDQSFSMAAYDDRALAAWAKEQKLDLIKK